MFRIHERLAAETLEVGCWPLCRVLLMNDRTYPWLILVPAREGLKDLHDLDPADHGAAMAEIAKAARALQRLFKPDKINVAALGNVVPQLHIHIVARFTTDAAWPRPVWGVRAPEPYDDPGARETIARLGRTFAADG